MSIIQTSRSVVRVAVCAIGAAGAEEFRKESALVPPDADPDVTVAHVTDMAGHALHNLHLFKTWVHAAWPNLERLYIVLNDNEDAVREGVYTFQILQLDLNLSHVHVQHHRPISADDPRFRLLGIDRILPRPHTCRGTQNTPCGCFEHECFRLEEVLGVASASAYTDKIYTVVMLTTPEPMLHVVRYRVVKTTDIVRDLIKEHCRVFTTVQKPLPGGDIIMSFQEVDVGFVSIQTLMG
jgi:hypothetical protein